MRIKFSTHLNFDFIKNHPIISINPTKQSNQIRHNIRKTAQSHQSRIVSAQWRAHTREGSESIRAPTRGVCSGDTACAGLTPFSLHFNNISHCIHYALRSWLWYDSRPFSACYGLIGVCYVLIRYMFWFCDVRNYWRVWEFSFVEIFWNTVLMSFFMCWWTNPFIFLFKCF